MIKSKDVHKHFKGLHVINDVSLEVGQGEVVVVCGPSDSDKSILVRIVNQLGSVESGGTRVDGINIAGSKTDLSKVHEEVDFVSQSFNLYPRLTVLENITPLPMEVKKQNLGQAQKKAMELLERVDLAHKRDVLPGQLSGRQQQCVVAVHGLAMEPRVMLFDEPISALDSEMVSEMLEVMRDLAESGMTTICVIHEMDFAHEVVDRVIFVGHGRIPEGGPSGEFSTHPKHERTRQFLQQVMVH